MNKWTNNNDNNKIKRKKKRKKNQKIDKDENGSYNITDILRLPNKENEK